MVPRVACPLCQNPAGTLDANGSRRHRWLLDCGSLLWRQSGRAEPADRSDRLHPAPHESARRTASEDRLATGRPACGLNLDRVQIRPRFAGSLEARPTPRDAAGSRGFSFSAPADTASCRDTGPDARGRRRCIPRRREAAPSPCSASGRPARNRPTRRMPRRTCRACWRPPT